jgi:hypothetical protein
MKKFVFLTLILISSCSTNSSNTNLINEMNFDEDTNLDQFILKLDTYSKNKSYPNIDN